MSGAHTGLARPTGAALLAGRRPSRRPRLGRRPRAHRGDLRLGARARPRDRSSRTGASRICSRRASGRAAASGPTFLRLYRHIPRSRAADANPDPVGLAHRGRQRPRRRAWCSGRPSLARRSWTSAAAVRDALRFPLSGSPLEALVTRRRPVDDRCPAAFAAAAGCAERPAAGGARDPRSASSTGSGCRRAGRRSSSPAGSGGARAAASSRRCSTPSAGATFRGRVEAHDADAPDLVTVADAGRDAVRVNRPLAETDLVVTRHRSGDRPARRPGRAARRVRRRRRRAAPRARTRSSRRQRRAAGSSGWRSSARSRRGVPVSGASLVLNPPRLTGPFRGYPYEESSLQHLAASPLPPPVAPPDAGSAAASSRASGGS